MSTIKIAVLASGSGTILKAIIESGVPVSMVLADRSCTAIEIARTAGIEYEIVDRRTWGYHEGVGENWDRAGFTSTVVNVLRASGIDLVAMAGFFTVLGPPMFQPGGFAGRVLNIHPAFEMDRFPGDTAVADQLEAKVKVAGSTVHIATPIMDDPTYRICRVPVPLEPGDTVETLWERIKIEERDLYPRVLQEILDGKINLEAIYAG